MSHFQTKKIDVMIAAKECREPLFKNINEHTPNAFIDAVGVLEKGTASGRTSMALVVKTHEGELFLVQLTAALFLGIAETVRDACASFADDGPAIPFNSDAH